MLIVKLTLAWLLGSFLFSFESWDKAKEKNKLASWQLYIDACLQFGLIMFLVYDPSFLVWALVLAFGHLAIESVQLLTLTDGKRRQNFLWGQAAHFVLILVLGLVYMRNTFAINDLHWNHLLLIVTALFALTTPASTVIKFFISRWAPETNTTGTSSLQEAGKYIGIIERLFVFAFVVSGHWEAIGFLLAAKSIFRFGDLKDGRERTLTEYVLIGTLLSFGIAILMGWGYLWIR